LHFLGKPVAKFPALSQDGESWRSFVWLTL
jgi:hypothetical protein